jgi:hypothetical protein
MPSNASPKSKGSLLKSGINSAALSLRSPALSLIESSGLLKSNARSSVSSRIKSALSVADSNGVPKLNGSLPPVLSSERSSDKSRSF